mmetsp:Transcript_12852/g.8962  ORF Transcript_12852/g.8962 Transcript_12852/m.8962 type:complete len:139 (-) Transcript_12852:73-489(-)|eukprot:CAMPEP_0116933530 /NCGR_PEP_ID=MMETSP0467-20121206/29095_1 /TAXON_ID=283647 /ORGANISM="Mesodinium pulex, Strain SPMC105" /LENGTH=138 /DNA_ID=CAMNT_0004614435 /DNA_START=173 /DNA_END=589 /DNA_ORIENTATION=-
MFISKKNRIAVYSYLFKEGTIVAKKDFVKTDHSEDVPVPNLEVLSLMKSFTSRGFVKNTFNWQWNYYYLTNEGIEFLRQYLALPADIVPATLKPLPARAGGREGGDGKKDFAGGDFNPEFSGEGGFGRGRRTNDGYRA